MLKFLLSNQITVLHHPIPTSHGVCVGLYINVGARHENRLNNGISHLLEHLHFRKLDGLSQRELYQYTDRMGTTLSASTYKEFTCFSLKIRPEFLEASIRLMKNLVEFSAWHKEDVEQEKEVILNEMAQKEYGTMLQRKFNSLLWKAHPLALPVIGTEENIESFELEEIISHKINFYTASNIAVVFTGNITEKDIGRANHILSEIKLPNGTRIISGGPPEMCVRKPDIHFVRMASSILEVSIAFDIPHNCCDNAVTILNCIVGRGSSSWLQAHFNESLKLESDIYTDITTYTDAACLSIHYSVKAPNLYDSLREIVLVLNRAKNCFTDEDLAVSKPFYTNNLWFELDDIEMLNFNIGWNQHIRKIDATTLEEKIASFSRVAESDLVNAARSIFKKENMTIMVCGATNKITKRAIMLVFESLQQDCRAGDGLHEPR